MSEFSVLLLVVLAIIAIGIWSIYLQLAAMQRMGWRIIEPILTFFHRPKLDYPDALHLLNRLGHCHDCESERRQYEASLGNEGSRLRRAESIPVLCTVSDCHEIVYVELDEEGHVRSLSVSDWAGPTHGSHLERIAQDDEEVRATAKRKRDAGIVL